MTIETFEKAQSLVSQLNKRKEEAKRLQTIEQEAGEVYMKIGSTYGEVNFYIKTGTPFELTGKVFISAILARYQEEIEKLNQEFSQL